MIKQCFDNFVKKCFNSWLNRRMPAAHVQQLSNRNIFIIPSKFGFVYLLFVILLFLLGTNYQNNVIILLSYIFASLFLTAMLQCFFNLSKLHFDCQQHISAYAKQHIKIPINIRSNSTRYTLSFKFPQQSCFVVNQLGKGETKIGVPYCPPCRGVNDPGRLKISSEYSLGLFICWTQLDFNCQITTYPEKRVFSNLLTSPNNNSNEQEQEGNIIDNGDDFGELRPYRLGESRAQIAWKQLAKGQGLLSKTNQQQQGSTIWLMLEKLPTANIETQLQMLCFLINECYRAGQPFGIDLGYIKIPPDMGYNHIENCLATLAYYPGKQ